MKRKIIALSLALITAFSLAACQKTPEQEFIVQKDTERMIEQARDEEHGTTAAELGVPEENYTFSATGADGRLVVNVDAPVIVPSANIPTARVSATGFTQKQVTGLFNYLFPDEKPLITTSDVSIRTKGDIQDSILLIKKHIAEGTTEKDMMMSEEGALEEIKRLEEELKMAPETAPSQGDMVKSDGTMLPSKTGAYGTTGALWEEDILMLNARTDRANIVVCTPASNNKRTEAYFSFSYRKEKDVYTEYNYVAAEVNEADGDLPQAAQGKLNLSFHDAKKLCEDFLAAGEIADMQLGRAYIVCDGYANSPEGPVLNNNPEHFAYDLYYVRTINGSPSVSLVDMYGTGFVDASSESDSEQTSMPWMYEMISFRVDDGGLANIYWQSPAETGEVLAEDTNLMTFDEIRRVFEAMIIRKYEPKAQPENYSDIKDINIEIDISEVKLGVVRVRTQNSGGREGIYIPAWVFYGQKTSNVTYEGGSTMNLYNNAVYDVGIDKPLMVINAVDGSIIDLSKGY